MSARSHPILVAAALGLLAPLGATAALLPGGGTRGTDCFALLDVESPLPPGGPRKVSCVDGDPSCDADGMCDGTCQFTVRVCVNDEGINGCRPPESLRSVKVGKNLVPVPESLVGASCGAPGAVTVPVRGPLLRQRPGRLRIRVSARGRGTDVDRFVLACMPRLGDCPPPTTTTTTRPATTTTTTTRPSSTTTSSTTTLPPVTTSSTTTSTTGTTVSPTSSTTPTTNTTTTTAAPTTSTTTSTTSTTAAPTTTTSTTAAPTTTSTSTTTTAPPTTTTTTTEPTTTTTEPPPPTTTTTTEPTTTTTTTSSTTIVP